MSSVFFYILSKWPWMLYGAIVGVAVYYFQKHRKNRNGKSEK